MLFKLESWGGSSTAYYNDDDDDFCRLSKGLLIGVWTQARAKVFVNYSKTFDLYVGVDDVV